jgi:hypothetical protein
MFHLLHEHFAWRARLLLSGRHEDLARHYILPLAVDLDGQCFVIRDPETLLAHLRRHQAALIQRMTLELIPTVVAVELPGSDGRVWLRWQERRTDGSLGGWSDVVYHLRRDGGWIRILAMTYTRLLVPHLARPIARPDIVRLP